MLSQDGSISREDIFIPGFDYFLNFTIQDNEGLENTRLTGKLAEKILFSGGTFALF